MLEDEDHERLEYYRATAQKLHELARAITYDFRRRGQLVALAEGFERAARRLEQGAKT